MRHMNKIFALLSGTWRRRSLAVVGALLAFALLQFGGARLTQAQQGVSDFDHASTGYVLNAQHQNVRCETCHLKGVFKGTPKDCASCHGWNNPRAKFSVMPTRHIPTGNATCESCHAANQAQFTDASRNFSHANVVSLTCINCHSSRNPHPGVVANPTDATHLAALNQNQGCDKCHTTVQFTGPKVPANHIPTAAVSCESCHIGGDYKFKPTVTNIHAFAPSTSTNCAQCHSPSAAARFSTATMTVPSSSSVANHIPMGSASCESCHVGAGSSIVSTPVTEGSSFGGSLYNHAGATVSCATCHGASVTPTTFYGVSPRVISDLRPAHVPTTAACETCHTAGAPTGLVPAAGMTTFANAQYSHAGITSGCETCHGPSLGNTSFYGITNLIVMPATSPAGSMSHMPTSTTCENCHAGSTPGGLVPANSPRALGSSLFRNAPPTAAMIHSGVTSGCGTCHGGTSEWVGVNLPDYTPNPRIKQSGASYTGFQTLPGSGGTYSVPDITHPVNNACEQCHTNTTAFSSIALPTGHIPYASSAGCGDCHDNNFSVSPSIPAIHAKIQSLSSNCEQCHSTDNAALYAATTSRRPIKTPAVNHYPMGGLGCASCHVGAGTPISTPVTASSFAGGGFVHTGITTGCGECHGSNVEAGTFSGTIVPTTVANQTPTHIPVSNSVGCETCHVNSVPSGLVASTGYTGSPSFDGGKYTHAGNNKACVDCHGTGKGPFKDVFNLVQLPSTAAPSGHIPIASTNGCENCHLGSVPAGLLSVSGAPTAVPGTLFANAPPTGSMIHADVSAGCNSCHEAGNLWLGMSAYPRVPATKNTANSAQLYNGFHTRPGTSASGYSMLDASHPATGECSQCHGNTTAFGAPALPAKHIPYATGAACTACHVSWGTPPTNTAIHANIQNKTGNCVQCHSTANAALYKPTISNPLGIKAPSTTAPVHVPMRNLGCESCHTASNTMTTFTNFTGGLFSHSGMSSNCAECHGPNVTGFQGITNIVKMPSTSAPGINSHIPSSTTCESCHLGSMPTTLVAGNASGQPPNSGFRSPAPTSGMIHAGVTGSCGTCHGANMVWMGMDVSEYTTRKTAPFTGFHSRPQSGIGTYWVTDAAHPNDDNCSSCHAGFTEWSAQIKPSNHIPTANVACTNCHTSSNYATMPRLSLIHANAPSSTSNCAQCHSAANALLYNTPNLSIVAPATNHIPMGNLGCENCHVGANSSLTLPVSDTAVFSGSAFSHAGITNGCDACHGSTINAGSFQGTTNIVVLPSTAMGANGHIPSPINAQCETCHLGSMPTTLVKAVATVTTPGSTKFKTPAPTGAMIHTGITGSCNSCHEAGMTWLNINLYPRSPTVKTANAVYTGFHTRPGSPALTNAILDANHPGGTTDCSACHGSTVNFSSAAKPSNHIPTSTTAQCQACHTNLAASNGVPVSAAASFRQVMSLTDIHANAPSTTANCAQCHSAANAAKYPLASRPAGIKSTANIGGTHIPYGTTACEACHVYTGGTLTTPVRDGATFAGGKFSHAGFSTGCATCHGAGVSNTTFYGVTAIVAIPASTTVNGPTTHIPYSAGCETCHAATVPTGLVSVTTTGTKFATPLATGTAIHANSGTFACMTCHERGYQWLGAEKYTRIPAGTTLPTNATAAIYKGFQTRPGTTGFAPYGYNSAGHVGGELDTGDCSQCHSGTTQFTGEGKPSGHMPFSAGSCSICHAPGNYTVTGLVRTGLHNQVTVPAAVVKYTAATLGNASCKTCHTVGTGGTSGTAPFAGCATPANCSSPPPITYQPDTVANIASHIPIKNLSCDACHVGTTSFSGVNMRSGTAAATMHANTTIAGIKCLNCHENGMKNMWTGITMKIREPGEHKTANRMAPNDCNNSGCHSFNGGFRALQKPVMRSAQVSPDMARIRPTVQTNKPSRGSLGTSFDHKGVVAGKCKDCHDGKAASGKPARHLMVDTSCDTCHRTTTWLPAQFNHDGITPNTCLACHNGMGASSKPAGHFMTSRSCDSCHKSMGWTPVNYQHTSPLYRASPDKLTCVSCHDTNGEIIRRQARSLTRTKPIPVGQ